MRTERHRWRRARDERGAALLEFALLLPLLMALLLGIVTGADAYSRKITIVDAVREGARYGATLDVGTEAAPYPIWTAAVQARVVEQSGGILEASDVCVDLDDPAVAPATPCDVADPASATVGSERLVKVSANKAADLEWFISSTELNLRGESVARYEREEG